MGHGGIFQTWETLIDRSSIEREHDGKTIEVGPVGLYAAQTETPDGMKAPRVVIYVDSYADDSLTPEQARELARRLTLLAEQIEALS